MVVLALESHVESYLFDMYVCFCEGALWSELRRVLLFSCCLFSIFLLLIYPTTQSIGTFIERFKRIVENKCNWANPACCCLMLLGYIIIDILQAFGRFSVVLHSITGKPFYESAYHSFRLLVKGGNIEHAISADYFISLSLELVA